MELFKHQIKALQWSNFREHFPCFMEMRTGKSLVALEKVKAWGGKTLLIAPLSTWFDWMNLFRSQGIKAIALLGSTKLKEERFCNTVDWMDWTLINPEGVTAWGKRFFELANGEFDNCLLDESVFIKNPKAKISKLLMKHKKMFAHRMVMTGTPIAETTEDIVTQMLWCLGEFMDQDNFYKWRARYMYPAKFGWGLKKGVKQLLRDELKRNSFVLSAKDAGMYVDQIRQVHLIALPQEMKDDYEEIQKAWLLGGVSTKYGIVKDIWLSQLSCGIYPIGIEKPSFCFKSKAIQQLLEGELRGQQVVIFSRWIKEVIAISKVLKCERISGSTEFSERERLLNEFRKGNFKYLVVQTKCACRGLDLSCVNTAIMCSNYWQYEIRAQIMARMKHPLKRIPTLFIDIITKDTIEEKVYEVLHEKHDNARYYLQRLKAKVKAWQRF
jgi:SNF2 family DNA or RNA helicase